MNRTVSQVVFKKKKEEMRQKIWSSGKRYDIQRTSGFHQLQGNAPPVKQGHILLETGWSTCEGGKAGPVY